MLPSFSHQISVNTRQKPSTALNGSKSSIGSQWTAGEISRKPLTSEGFKQRQHLWLWQIKIGPSISQDRSSMLRLCDATRSSKNWAKSMHWWRPQDTTDNSVRNLVRRPWVQNVFGIQVKLVTSVIPVVPLLLQFWSVLSIWPNMDSQNNPLVLLLLFLCICVEVPYLPVAKVSKYQTWTLTSENEEHAHTDAHFSSHLLSRWVSPYNHAGMMSWLNKCCFPLSV